MWDDRLGWRYLGAGGRVTPALLEVAAAAAQARRRELEAATRYALHGPRPRMTEADIGLDMPRPAVRGRSTI